MMKTIAIIWIAGWISLLSGKEEILFQSNFAENREMKGWTDVRQNNPPEKMSYKTVVTEGCVILQTPKNLFGISHGLSRPVMIGSSLKRITLRVILRQPETVPAGWQMGIALSSRSTVARDAGQAFWKGRDSGILANGYVHSLQMPNFIACQVEGRQIRATRIRPPFGLLKQRGQWNVWTLIYDNEKKEILFYQDADASAPWVTLHKTDLSGVMLNSLWLGAWGTEYKNITVTCETK